jgi:hypothetical protein
MRAKDENRPLCADIADLAHDGVGALLEDFGVTISWHICA